MPMPLPIGEPSGITAAQPASSSRRARIGSSLVYGQHDEAVGDERLGGVQQLDRVGQQRVVVADHLELDPVGLERLAGEPGGGDRVARGEAAGGVRQHLAARLAEHLDDRAARRRVDAPQRDRRQLGARGRGGLAPSPRGCESRRCRGSAATRSCVPRSPSLSLPAPPAAPRAPGRRAAASAPTRRAGRPRRRPPPPPRARPRARRRPRPRRQPSRRRRARGARR